MTLKAKLKILGFAPFLVYLMIKQVFSLSFEVKMSILFLIMLITLGSLIIRERMGEDLQSKQLIAVTACLWLTFAVFRYFVNVV
jgi:hypothetical protein